MATAPFLPTPPRASRAPVRDCSIGLHSVSRASIARHGDAVTGRCTRCGARMVKNVVTRSWYVSGLMG